MRLAGLALAAFAVHLALGFAVQSHPAAFGVDRTALNLASDLRQPTLTDVVRFLTDVGSLPVAALVTGLGALYAQRQGRPGQALALVLGMVALFILLNVSKGIWDRPRPASRFYDPHGYSYPSGHSAYVTAWLAAASVSGRRAIIMSASVVVLAVMASRLYLHVHYLTDVLGGAALGAAVFATVLIRR